MADYSDRILDAIRPVLADESDGEHAAYRGIPTGFVGAVEMIGDDGEPYIIVLRSPSNLPMWRMLGLSEYVSADIRAQLCKPDEDD